MPVSCAISLWRRRAICAVLKLDDRAAYMSLGGKPELASIRQEYPAQRPETGNEGVLCPATASAATGFEAPGVLGMQKNIGWKPYFRARGARAPRYELGVTLECA